VADDEGEELGAVSHEDQSEVLQSRPPRSPLKPINQPRPSWSSALLDPSFRASEARRNALIEAEVHSTLALMPHIMMPPSTVSMAASTASARQSMTCTATPAPPKSIPPQISPSLKSKTVSKRPIKSSQERLQELIRSRRWTMTVQHGVTVPSPERGSQKASTKPTEYQADQSVPRSASSQLQRAAPLSSCVADANDATGRPVAALPQTTTRVAPAGSATGEDPSGLQENRLRNVNRDSVREGVHTLLRRALDPRSLTRKEVRVSLEAHMNCDLSGWRDTIKEACVDFLH